MINKGQQREREIILKCHHFTANMCFLFHVGSHPDSNTMERKPGVPSCVSGYRPTASQGAVKLKPSGQPPRPAAALGLRFLPNFLLVRFPRPPPPLGTDHFCFLLAKTPNWDLSLHSCGVVTCPKFLVRSHCVLGLLEKMGQPLMFPVRRTSHRAALV